LPPLPLIPGYKESSRPSLSIAACTDRGLLRPNNEDSVLVLDLEKGSRHLEPMSVMLTLGASGVALAVADGMGGHQSGEVASSLCVAELADALLNQIERDPGLSASPRDLLQRAVETAHEAVYSRSSQRPEFHGMGTTLTAALVRGTAAEIAQVGDSRAYRLRNKVLTQLTEDQIAANMLLPEQRAHVSENIKEMLTQAVGAQPQVKAALTRIALQAGDILLLCCDGLYKVVSDSAITEILLMPLSLMAKAEGLIARANENGGPDNISVILAEIAK
jgi:serine/threonine protein phosphatase PrpC